MAYYPAEYAESQSPSKPGHYSNKVIANGMNQSSCRNPLQNRVTIQMEMEKCHARRKSRNPLQNRVTIQIPLRFNTRKNFMSQSPSKPGHYSNTAKKEWIDFNNCRNPLQNRVTIQIIPMTGGGGGGRSQSPSKPGHYSNDHR